MNLNRQWAINNSEAIVPRITFLYNQFILVLNENNERLTINEINRIQDFRHALRRKAIVIFQKLDLEFVFSLESGEIVFQDNLTMAAAISSLALNILQNYDGNAEMLQPFMDQLTYIDSIKETHEQIIVRLINTKLSGNARSWANDVNTIIGIRDAIRDRVSPPSAE